MSISQTPHRFRRPVSAFTTALILILCCSQQDATAATIHVNTPKQGITDNNHCSLQEAIYASEFKMNTAIGSTDPDSAYTTGCTPGSGDEDN
jgi:hypothetical protein